MPVSGVVVVCEPETVDAVRREIAGHPRLEVRDETEAGLIVVTDTESVKQDRQDVDWLDKLDGVTNAYVTFSSMEDVAPEGEES